MNKNPRSNLVATAFHFIEDEVPPSQFEHDADILRRVHVFIRERVIARHQGKLPTARTIAARLIVLQILIDPDAHRSLREYAKELGVTPAWLSKIARQFSASIGMQASWQRPRASDAYRRRATAVHAGTHVASEKWQRRKIRESYASANNKRAISSDPNGVRVLPEPALDR